MFKEGLFHSQSYSRAAIGQFRFMLCEMLLILNQTDTIIDIIIQRHFSKLVLMKSLLTAFHFIKIMLLVSLIGAGVQLFGVSIATICIAMLGMLSPSSRGSLTTASFVLFILMG